MKPGDVVQLRCGGPKMVITDEWGKGDDRRLLAVWFDDEKHLQQMTLKPEAAAFQVISRSLVNDEGMG